MRVLGVACLALGAVGLLLMAGHIAWQEVKNLTYVSRLDRWAEDVVEFEDLTDQERRFLAQLFEESDKWR